MTTTQINGMRQMNFELITKMAAAEEIDRQRKAKAIDDLKKIKPCGHCLFVVGCDCCLDAEESGIH
jgi:hypothetical protein